LAADVELFSDPKRIADAGAISMASNPSPANPLEVRSRTNDFLT
jgi:hypothetical protein